MNLVELRVTTTGGAGTATGTATTPQAISGRIVAVVLNYHASAPGATTDVNLYMAIAPTDLILDYDDTATDVTLYPRKQVCEADGTVLTYDGSRKVVDNFVVHGKLTLAVAQCNALTDAVVAYIFYE